jgi:hypothetical protein
MFLLFQKLVTSVLKKYVVHCGCSRVILHYKSCKLEEMVAMYIKHTVLDKNHTELEVQCSGCVLTYHSKLLILSSDIFIFIDFMILVQPHFGPGVDSSSNRNEYQE